MGDTRFQVVYLIVFLTHQSSFYNLYYDNVDKVAKSKLVESVLVSGGSHISGLSVEI